MLTDDLALTSELAARVCKALNINPAHVQRVVIDLEAGKPPRVVVTFLPAEAIGRVDVNDIRAAMVIVRQVGEGYDYATD